MHSYGQGVSHIPYRMRKNRTRFSRFINETSDNQYLPCVYGADDASTMTRCLLLWSAVAVAVAVAKNYAAHRHYPIMALNNGT